MSNIDFEKFGKYSKPGPRYTSYPTALEFSDAFNYEKYIELLSEPRALPVMAGPLVYVAHDAPGGLTMTQHDAGVAMMVLWALLFLALSARMLTRKR